MPIPALIGSIGALAGGLGSVFGGGGNPQWMMNPYMRDVFDSLRQQLHAFPTREQWLGEQLRPIRDQLALQAQRSRGVIGANLASRGFSGPDQGAYAAALGQIEAGRQQGMAGAATDLSAMYFPMLMQLYQQMAQAGTNVYQRQAPYERDYTGLVEGLAGTGLNIWDLLRNRNQSEQTGGGGNQTNPGLALYFGG